MSETGTIRWEFDDEEGLSPIHAPALLTFDVGFTFEKGCRGTWDYHGDDDEVEFVEFTFVSAADSDGNSFGKDKWPIEAALLEDWFAAWVGKHDGEFDRMRAAAIEQLEEDATPTERERP